uniref:Uncharacterized protein n=1 Tax=Romanomermis culicivorax TaxID=13658 RepID=A0A915J3C8_ROMCU
MIKEESSVGSLAESFLKAFLYVLPCWPICNDAKVAKAQLHSRLELKIILNNKATISPRLFTGLVNGSRHDLPFLNLPIFTRKQHELYKYAKFSHNTPPHSDNARRRHLQSVTRGHARGAKAPCAAHNDVRILTTGG